MNSLPNDKILDWSKLKAFADDKINVIKKLKSDIRWVANSVGKGQNAQVSSIFFFSHNVFKRLLSLGHYKLGLCGKKLTFYQTTKFVGIKSMTVQTTE